MLAEKLRSATAAAPVGAWDLSYAYYDPPANLTWDISTGNYVSSFSVDEETMTNGIFFKPDGLRMYITGSSGDDVNEYHLSNAWNIRSAVYIRNFSVNAQEIFPQDVFFKPDGLKMYIIGSSGDDVNEYNLSTAWNVTTASYLQNFSVAAQETTPTGIFFKPDGLKMYITGSSGDEVNEYNLSTAWDISTASYLQNFSVSSQDASPQGISFRSDGLRMFIAGGFGVDVNEYTLSTAWNISTASYLRRFIPTSINTSMTGIFFSSNGGNMFLIGEWDNGVATPVERVENYVVSGFNVLDQEATPTGIFFKPDGTKMYIAGSTGDEVNEYNLSTAWDTGTASYLQNFSVAAQETATEDIFFKPDGTKMYIVGSTGDDVNEYNLSTAWDISTASYLQRFSVQLQDTGPTGIFFKPDGLKMYIVGSTGEDVNEYNLSTAWDISTASYLQNFSVSSQEINPNGVFFKPNGLKMYIVGSTGDEVNEYNLSTAWDISTASYLQNFSLDAQDAQAEGIFFKPDGTKMYIVGGSDRVLQYSLGIQE
jgi:sugar lactone lactonase YvrE